MTEIVTRPRAQLQAITQDVQAITPELPAAASQLTNVAVSVQPAATQTMIRGADFCLQFPQRSALLNRYLAAMQTEYIRAPILSTVAQQVDRLMRMPNGPFVVCALVTAQAMVGNVGPIADAAVGSDFLIPEFSHFLTFSVDAALAARGMTCHSRP